MLKNLKNWKVKKKLFVSHGIIIVLSLLIALGGAFGMNTLSAQLENITDKALPNTERIWEIRRNLQAEQSWSYSAMLETNDSKVDYYLAQAKENIDKNKALLVEYQENAKIDPTLLSELNDIIAQQEGPRNEFHRLVKTNTDESNARAYLLMRDTSEAFRDIRGTKVVGIPLLVVDGEPYVLEDENQAERLIEELELGK